MKIDVNDRNMADVQMILDTNAVLTRLWDQLPVHLRTQEYAGALTQSMRAARELATRTMNALEEDDTNPAIRVQAAIRRLNAARIGAEEIRVTIAVADGSEGSGAAGTVNP